MDTLWGTGREGGDTGLSCGALGDKTGELERHWEGQGGHWEGMVGHWERGKQAGGYWEGTGREETGSGMDLGDLGGNGVALGETGVDWV